MARTNAQMMADLTTTSNTSFCGLTKRGVNETAVGNTTRRFVVINTTNQTHKHNAIKHWECH